jgi:pimeloyl-ACP methyl ester carboxylesterase
MTAIVNNEKFRKQIPTIVYIHGWLCNGELEESVMAIRSAYRGRNDHNFISIDWSVYSHWNVPVPYVSAMTKLKTVTSTFFKPLNNIK